ncbi:CHAT domain-containing protein [Phormidium sp. FACHB-1136]|uniref:CHAT domain-containing protein n=1 Tax=Phormidium sp. FACHB-1136 TaxID=2692848 RepID=UPI00168643A7|nr:CHAT domain-containing protein [Phormidium sp. FACHB-1136]MBD2425417.1 hypothetical protein [Phormidium sp. FACHB-1136]
MNKIVVLRLDYLSDSSLYQVTAEIGNEGQASSMVVQGWLPKISDGFLKILKDWKIAFSKLDTPRRLKVRKVLIDQSIETCPGSSSSLSIDKLNLSWNEVCRQLAGKLSAEMNVWLNSSGFQPIRQKLNQELHFKENIQIIVCPNDSIICDLPWLCWDVLKGFHNAEICFDLGDESYSDTYSKNLRLKSRLEGLKFLIVLGDNEGLDLERDEWILDNQIFKQTDVFSKILKPSRSEFVEALESGAWDILFFSGHSETINGEGIIYLKNGEAVCLSELGLSFKKAISMGLKLAIFNSCDGIGIARSLQKLQLPQSIVMREPIPDKVAHDFLTAYIRTLQSLNSDSPLYLASRRSREVLKDSIVCADWLPIVFQSHKTVSPVRGFIEKSRPVVFDNQNSESISSSQISPEFQFEEHIYDKGEKREKEIYKVVVLDPIGEHSIGKIQYMGVLWKAKMLPLKKFKKYGFEKFNNISLVFPGDEVSAVAREGNIYFVLPKNLAESESFKQLKLKFQEDTRPRKREFLIPFLMFPFICFSLAILIFYNSSREEKVTQISPISLENRYV